MTGYTRTWDCRICKQGQDTIDTPRRHLVCDDCVTNVARPMCAEALRLSLDTPGVDKAFWMRKASDLIADLMLRWKNPS